MPIIRYIGTGSIKANGEPDVMVFELPTALFLIWESGDEHQVDTMRNCFPSLWCPVGLCRSKEALLNNGTRLLRLNTVPYFWITRRSV
ncbi:MAG: hypothetical protein IPL64_10125 [Flavobacteriales bacterium]|nr:hypothetical protein [Flavobacteriales bacterium]MBK8532238.1 hypothetical protein [Flavobacteriales bacterium]